MIAMLTEPIATAAKLAKNIVVITAKIIAAIITTVITVVIDLV